MSDQEESQLREGLSALNKYALTKPIRAKIAKGDQPVMNMVQSYLCKVLRDRVASPVQKFAKDAIETFNDAFISQFQETVLTVIEQAALFRKESKDNDRGRFYFSDQPDQQMSQLGNSYLQLCLENIWVWSKWFPVDPDKQCVSLYKICLERLWIQGVKFPMIKYYDMDLVMSNMPDLQVPIKLLKQCRAVIRADFKKNPNGSGLRQLQPQMSSELRTEIARADKVAVFYAQIFHRVYKKALEAGSSSQQSESKSSAPPRKTVQLQEAVVEFDDEVSRKSTNSNGNGGSRKLQLLVKEIGSLKNEFQEIKKENEQLKQQLKIMEQRPYQSQVNFHPRAEKFNQQIAMQQTMPAQMSAPMQQSSIHSELQRSMPFTNPNPISNVSLRMSSREMTAQLIQQSRLIQSKSTKKSKIQQF